MGKFEITNDEQAKALINSVISDMQRISRIYHKTENLKEIKITIDELIDYYGKS